jgi:hypothetical protein
MIHTGGAREEDRPEWLRMRRALWEDCPDEQQVREIEEILSSDSEEVLETGMPSGYSCTDPISLHTTFRPCEGSHDRSRTHAS